MSGLNLLGGIGKGLMAGSEFILKQREHEQTGAYRRAAADYYKQRTASDQAKLQQDNDERQQLADYSALLQETAAELGPDVAPETLGAEVLRRGLAAGRIPRTELEPLLGHARKARQLGITQALRLGDVGRLGEIFSAQYKKPVDMGLVEGKDELGRPTNLYRITDHETGQPIGQLTPMQLGSLFGADDLLAEEEQKLKLQKAHSEIRENEAQAGAAEALARQRSTATPRGTGLAALSGQPAGVREEALRVQLASKVAGGTATPEERALFDRLQDRATQGASGSGKPYVPAAQKTANYWRGADEAEIAAEVERQIAAMRAKTLPGSWERDLLEQPETLEELRRDIRGKLGVAGAPSMPSGSQGAQRSAPDLNSYFR